MATVSRRGLLLGGGLTLGAAAVGAATLPALAADREPAAAAADLRRLGDPQPFVTIDTLATRSTMQDVVLEPENGWLFVSQATSGSNGSRFPSETTVINRVRVSDGALLDSMQLIDGGHGLGFEVELRRGQPWIWMTWHGSDDDVVRMRYVPGSYRRGEADGRLDLEQIAFQHKEGRDREAVYHFDAAGDVAVERHFHFPGGSEAPSETYYRRSVSGLLSGSSASRGSITLPATPPTVQGFATVGDSLFRLVGVTARGGSQDPDDPIAIEQYSWSSGRMVAKRQYPTLAQDGDGRWKDGVLEPQGLGVRRRAGGTSLLIGVTTGDTGRRDYQVLELPGVG